MTRNTFKPPPPPIDEPPHPNFWSNKWPHPRFGRKEPDKLLVYFMEWYRLDPNDFKNRKSRYQYIHQHGRFRCYDPNCLAKNGDRSFWTSHLTWVRFDMYNESIRLFGQKCKKCGGERYGRKYCYPLPFYYEDWRAFCITAINKALKKMYVKDESFTIMIQPCTIFFQI